MAIIVKGGGGKPEEEKTVTAGTSTKVVTPSDGKTIKKVTVNPTPSQSKTVTPSTSQQTISPDSGKLLSSVVISGDSDLVAGNIKKGIDIFGVLGTMAEGIAFEDISRFTKVAVDTFTFASNQDLGSNIKLTHSLGVKPQVVLLFSKTKPDIRNCIVEMLQSAAGTYAYEELNHVTTNVNTGAFMLETTQVVANTIWIPTSSLVKLPDKSGYFLGAGIEYTLITMA